MTESILMTGSYKEPAHAECWNAGRSVLQEVDWACLHSTHKSIIDAFDSKRCLPRICTSSASFAFHKGSWKKFASASTSLASLVPMNETYRVSGELATRYLQYSMTDHPASAAFVQCSLARITCLGGHALNHHRKGRRLDHLSQEIRRSAIAWRLHADSVHWQGKRLPVMGVRQGALNGLDVQQAWRELVPELIDCINRLLRPHIMSFVDAF